MLNTFIYFITQTDIDLNVPKYDFGTSGSILDSIVYFFKYVWSLFTDLLNTLEFVLGQLNDSTNTIETYVDYINGTTSLSAEHSFIIELLGNVRFILGDFAWNLIYLAILLAVMIVIVSLTISIFNIFGKVLDQLGISSIFFKTIGTHIPSGWINYK